MDLFSQIAIAFVFASLFAILARFFRQPLILGYLIAGIFLVGLGIVQIEDPAVLETLGKLGVAFLLFLVGLEIDISTLRSLGKIAIATGLGQIAFTSLVGYVLALLFGFSPISSLYIAVALTFSSTIIAVKLLSEKKDLDSLYGRIAVGFLLVQDFVAIFILVFLASLGSSAGVWSGILQTILKLVIIGVLLVLSQKILPKIFNKIASSTELLFIVSIAWALGSASLLQSPLIDFSLEIGGFIAGVALANSVGHLQIASRVKPLRDFFLTVFFLVLGMELFTTLSWSLSLPILAFSLLVFIGNPLIIMIIMGLAGYHARTAFLASVTVAQIFEFSFIVMAMGRTLGHVGEREMSLITAVGVITVIASSYLISNSNKIYPKIAKFLRNFQKNRTIESAFTVRKEYKDHIVLIGCNRAGRAILPFLQRYEDRLVILDFNPHTIERLLSEGYDAVYGDAADIETLDALSLQNADLIVSTDTSFEDNIFLLDYLKGKKKKPTVVFIASHPQEALSLYEKGADYVIVPQAVGGEHLGHLLSLYTKDKNYFLRLRNRHFSYLARERFRI